MFSLFGLRCTLSISDRTRFPFIAILSDSSPFIDIVSCRARLSLSMYSSIYRDLDLVFRYRIGLDFRLSIYYRSRSRSSISCPTRLLCSPIQQYIYRHRSRWPVSYRDRLCLYRYSIRLDSVPRYHDIWPDSVYRYPSRKPKYTNTTGMLMNTNKTSVTHHMPGTYHIVYTC